MTSLPVDSHVQAAIEMEDWGALSPLAVKLPLHRDTLSEEEESGDQWLAILNDIITGHLNESRDTSAPILKPIVRNYYPIFVLQYGMLMLVGATANVLICVHIMRRKLYRDVTHALILNLVLSHCVQCFVVVPMTLTVLLVQNWILGQFFCYFLPMLQVSNVLLLSSFLLLLLLHSRESSLLADF